MIPIRMFAVALAAILVGFLGLALPVSAVASAPSVASGSCGQHGHHRADVSVEPTTKPRVPCGGYNASIGAGVVAAPGLPDGHEASIAVGTLDECVYRHS